MKKNWIKRQLWEK